MGTQLVEGDETPDVEDLRGREVAGAEPVRIDGPVLVKALPNKGGTARNYLVTDQLAVCIARTDLTRTRLIIRSRDAAFWLAFSKSEVDASSGAYCPTTVTPLELNVSCEVWVKAATATPTLISVITESWTY